MQNILKWDFACNNISVTKISDFERCYGETAGWKVHWDRYFGVNTSYCVFLGMMFLVNNLFFWWRLIVHEAKFCEWMKLIPCLVLAQYLRHIKLRKLPLFERYPILLSVIVIWAFAYLLTVSGAYRHVSQKTKLHCRADKADLIGTAPW